MIELQSIKERLAHFGYTATVTDDGIISYIMASVQNGVKGTLNVLNIPEYVENIIIDKIIGEFLLTKKNSGQDIGIDLEAATKSIQEGDTNVSFDISASPEARINVLIKWLINGRDGSLMRYRRLPW